MSKTQLITDKKFSDNVFKNFRDLFFDPEITRRKKEKTIKDDFQLLAAQVIFFPNGEKPIIRLNQEVKATVKVKKNTDITARNFGINNDEVEAIIFDDEEYQNCGHVTMILFKNGYQLSFDFRYNREICKKYLLVGKEFMITSEYCYKNEFYSAFIDNAFSSIELFAKCKLLIATNQSMYGKTNHKAIKAEFNKYHRKSITGTEQNETKTLNKLSELRKSARYLDGEFKSTEVDLEIILITIKEMYNEIKEKID